MELGYHITIYSFVNNKNQTKYNHVYNVQIDFTFILDFVPIEYQSL